MRAAHLFLKEKLRRLDEEREAVLREKKELLEKEMLHLREEQKLIRRRLREEMEL